jgi:hypothetical protein
VRRVCTRLGTTGIALYTFGADDRRGHRQLARLSLRIASEAVGIRSPGLQSNRSRALNGGYRRFGPGFGSPALSENSFGRGSERPRVISRSNAHGNGGNEPGRQDGHADSPRQFPQPQRERVPTFWTRRWSRHSHAHELCASPEAVAKPLWQRNWPDDHSVHA